MLAYNRRRYQTTHIYPRSPDTNPHPNVCACAPPVTPGFKMPRKPCIKPGTLIYIGASTLPRTGSSGYIQVENLNSEIGAGPDGDVFSFAVLMLYIFVRPEENVEHQHDERRGVAI